MNRLTSEQRLQIVEIYFQNQCSVRNVFRALRPFYGVHNRPTERTIRETINKFRTTFSLLDVHHPTRVRRSRTAGNIAAVAESVREDPKQSIRRRSQGLGLSYGTLWSILKKDLGLKAYKIQLVQELKPLDHPMRQRFGLWALEQLQIDPFFYRKIVFSDEAHFWLNGYVNKQNCRIWADEQPEVTHELLMHPEKCTVWCGVWAGGIIGPYFFKNAEGQRVNVNGANYRAMINELLLPTIQDIGVADLWFQQDGATCHTARQTIDLLRETFDENIISRNGPVNWPPRSCDLTPLDYFLWGYLKSLVYADKPQTIPALEANITRVINGIPAEMLERVLENWTHRMDHLRVSRGQHLKEIIFNH